jgi:two-component system chemotaxis response regulator CheY
MAEILLIDDMKGVRRAIVSLLSRAGHAVTEAADGTDGIDLLRSGKRFDLVITDILMPRQDGSEVVLFLKTLPNRPKILVISGGGSQVSAGEALMLARTQADASLAKPFDSDELMATVDRLLRKAA